MRVAIIQSCYIPWKGLFDLIGRCDEYVIFDSAQYVKGHWHNRNRIKTANGLKWLTIPVITSGRLGQSIREVEIGKPWADQHWQTLEQAYKRAPFFESLSPIIKGWYELAEKQSRLSDINAIFLNGVTEQLELRTRITHDTSYPSKGIKTERVLGIVMAAGADRYLTGPSAKAYFDESMFSAAGIAVEWMTYDNYPEYKQLHEPFDHQVSIIDTLFNTGLNAKNFVTRDCAPTLSQ